jgi:hypothetical protein
VVKIEGYSPQEIRDLGWTSPRSTGLSNVGIGQVVYLVGQDSLNATVTAYAWLLASKPAGSSAALDSTNKKQTTFKPDVAGKFTVQLVITTAGGASKARSVTINAAKFVGVGGMDGLPIDVAAGQCALCHSTNFTQWTQTGHSNMLKRGLKGVLSLSYSEACIECHTTGHDNSPSAVNDGFDDIKKELGWVFPGQLKTGVYDTLTLKYPKLAHRANVQCESCHGPGSKHLGDKSGIAMSLDEAACGYCHEKDPYRKNTQWKESLHAVGIASASTNPSCTKCHSGWGFIRRVDPLPNDKRPSSGFPQISCAVCHDQHRADLPSQVRRLDNVTLGDSLTVVNYGGLGKVCMQCHISRQDAVDYSNNPANLNTRFGPHQSNQADMIDGSNAIEYNAPIGTSGHKFAVTNACVTCHMQPTPATGMPGNNKIGEHTFAMKWDGGTPGNPADDVEHVAACQSCHGSIKSFDDIMAKDDYDKDGTTESTRSEVRGLLEKLNKLLPPRTTDAIVKENYSWTLPGLTPAQVAQRKAYTKAWYNLLFVEEDGSLGVHNAGYAIALLRRSTDSLSMSNSSPTAPTLASPSANAFTNDNTPALVFNVPQDANGDQLHFKIEIDDDGNFGAGTQTFESKSSATGFSPTPPVTQGTGQITYTVQSALADGDWWWRVSAWDGQVYGSSSAARKFVVDVTKPFTSNHNPAKGATDVPINANIVAHVQDAASGVKQSAIVMKVNGSNVVPTITGTALDFTLNYDPPADFGFQQTINVSIDAADSAGNVMATDAYSLITGGNSAPAAPTLVSPTANTFTNDNTPSLTFNVPTDPNGDQLHFKLEIDDDGNFGAGTQTYESKTSTTGFSPTPPVTQGTGQETYTIQTSLADGDWWWRVSAWDGQVYGNVSIARKFIVDQSAPRLTPLPVSSAASGQNQIVSATITDNIGIQTATLFHRQGGASAYSSETMSNIGGDAYRGLIPGSAINERGLEYYIAVADSAGNPRTFPVTNPQARPEVIQVTSGNLLFKNATPAKAYRMISVPFDLDDKSAASALSDDFPGAYDQIQWRLLRYLDPRTNIEYGSPVFPAIAPGTGFWLITKETKNLDAGAGKSVTTAQNYIITLPPGWSQIGNPFAFTVNWSEVIKGANVEDKLVGYQGSLNEATGYDYARMQLVPFEGYFVNNRGSTSTTIEIPPKAASNSNLAKEAKNLLVQKKLAGNEWGIQITTACDRYLDKDNYLGNLNNASDEWDANDFSEAPFFDQHVALYFPHPEWQKYPDLYTGDFRAVKPEGDYWDFVVKSAVAKSEAARSEVVLKLTEAQNLPADWKVILLDKASRVAINFSEKNQYAFPSGNENSTREFRLVVGKKDFVETNDLNLSGVPQAFALGQNYPNPFNPETRINYELPVTSHVKISVYNLQGQIVRTLFDGEQSTGRYTVSWDGANANGDRVVSGLYLVRMEAGPSASSGQGFVAVRKMILAK